MQRLIVSGFYENVSKKESHVRRQERLAFNLNKTLQN